MRIGVKSELWRTLDLLAPEHIVPLAAQRDLGAAARGGKYLIICALSYDPPYKPPYK
jgi:hypothetical protein